MFSIHKTPFIQIFYTQLPSLLIIHTSLDRGYYMMIISFVKTDRDHRFKQTIINWLWHFAKAIEYHAQQVDSYKKLTAFVVLAAKDTKLTKALVSNTLKWLRESFQTYLPLLCQCNYHAVYGGNTHENCWVQSDNAALKKDPMKPKSNHILYVAADRVVNNFKGRTPSIKHNSCNHSWHIIVSHKCIMYT